MEGLVHGIHAVISLLEQRPEAVERAFLARTRDNKRLASLEASLAKHEIPVTRVERAKLDELTGGARHQGVAARVRSLPAMSERDLHRLVAELRNGVCVLVLDGVQDPRNLGACLRSAAAAGADAVLVPKNRAARLTSGALKAASGAAELVPLVRVTNLARALDRLAEAGVRLVGLTGESRKSLYELDLCRPIALVLGGEQRGLRRLTRERCHELAAIPMRGAVGSLNVAVAAGVALFELNRQNPPTALVRQRAVR